MKFNILVLLFLLTLSSCSKDEEKPEVIKSEAKEITSFEIQGVTTEIEGDIIKIYAPASLDFYSWKPTINISEKASISPEINVKVDFANPILFRVYAEDGSFKLYTTELILLEGLQEIILKLRTKDDEQTAVDRYLGKIDELNNKIQIDYSGDTVERWESWDLLPYLAIETTNDLETLPANNHFIDLSIKDHQLTIPGLDKIYELSIQSSDNFIKGINLPLRKEFISTNFAKNAFPEFIIGLEEDDILFYTLKNQDLTNITPDYLRISDYASITPDPSLPQDFSEDVVYTLTSESGISKTRKVRVVEKNILISNATNGAFSLSYNTNFFRYYIATSPIVDVELVNVETGEILGSEIGQNYETEDGRFYLQMNADEMPESKTSFFYRVTLEEGVTIDTHGGVIFDPDGN
ncbi:hypothetical protein LCGC14_0129340 [marine sediment metagenome]|uniref:Uncharacterized protein n=1 Tax=marine sediment metagenome TaxID=412755 RepID=A0A0F9VJY8_9ZZZZ|nr:hypothetical protein [Maribacter sp.]HDZ06098.1 hypothetical protein [Maribacter sp.]